MGHRSNHTAKLLLGAAFAAGMLLGVPNDAAATPAPDRFAAPVKALSAFDVEQTMSPAQLIERWAPLIENAAKRFGIQQSWIRAVMRQESGGRTMLAADRPITSDKGAMGIMQVMPETYREMQDELGLGADPYDAKNNVLAGAAYLSWLHEKYGYPAMFAAYNAGPGAYEDSKNGAKLPAETIAYVGGIGRILGDKTLTTAQPMSVSATLTRPDGSSITIDGTTVKSVRASLPDEYAPSVHTVVSIGSVNQGVREDLATVVSIVRSHGGKV